MVIVCFKDGLKTAQHLDIRPAKSNQRGVVVRQLIAGAGPAHGVETQLFIAQALGIKVGKEIMVPSSGLACPL